jgi:nucleotide-binding universal stress UspA family protein
MPFLTVPAGNFNCAAKEAGMFKRIVVATDRVTARDAPVVSAARMARRHGARLYLLHVMESASEANRRLIRHFESGEEMTADPDYARCLGRALQRTYQEDLADIAHEVGIGTGFPWEEILRWAKAVDSDLIVLGPHSTRAQEMGVVRVSGRIGSTVENVVTRETSPVMVVNRPAEPERLLFRRVLVAVDFSRSCECAVCFAARLAACCHSSLTVFHMIPVPPFPKYSRADLAADEMHARRRLESFYGPYLEGSDHRYLTRPGAMPHLEILASAGKEDVDLIIMGSHTKETAGKWYPGSAVERVGHGAACPLTVVTDPEVLTHWEGVLRDVCREEKDRRIHVFSATHHDGVVIYP